MATFAIRSSHPPDQCPVSNSKVRAFVEKSAGDIPKIAERLAVKIVAGPFILGAEHESVVVVEAGSAEVVNDFVLQTGMAHWNSVKVSLATPMNEALGELSGLPAPLY